MRWMIFVLSLLVLGCEAEQAQHQDKKLCFDNGICFFQHILLQRDLEASVYRTMAPGQITYFYDDRSRHAPYEGNLVLDVEEGQFSRVSGVYRFASNTKTYVAVAALRLVERGQLDLDAPLRDVLPQPYLRTLSQGGYDVDQITTRMLLQHTSGIADHSQQPAFFNEIVENPGREWTRLHQLSLAMTQGVATGQPGERYAYSDTGYILVGAIIEELTGKNIGLSVRELTRPQDEAGSPPWWEGQEEPDSPYYVRLPQTAFGMSVWDIHYSVDTFGGGGLVGGDSNLARFHRAAASGELLGDPSLNALLITPSPQSIAAGNPYGMGFFIREYAGETCYEHTGFWGTLAVYCPRSDFAFAAAVTNADTQFADLHPMMELMLVSSRER